MQKKFSLVSILAKSIIFSLSNLALVSAEPVVGQGFYAMEHPKWPCEESLRTLKEAKVPAISVLWHTFGNDASCLERFLRDPRDKALEIFLINEPCQRNARCGSYEFLHDISVREYREKLEKNDPALIQKIEDYITAPSLLINRYASSKLRCFIAPGLETGLSPRAFKKLRDVVSPYFPGCEIVWNPLYENKPIRGTYFEAHGLETKAVSPCIASLDGYDFRTVDVSSYFKRFRKCSYIFMWANSYNAIGSGRFEDPRARSDFPTKDILKASTGYVRPLRKLPKKEET